MRNIDTMSKEQIATELLRIASYCNETYRLNQAAAGKASKAPYGSRTQGEAIGRQDMCARICDDLYLTFGIAA